MTTKWTGIVSLLMLLALQSGCVRHSQPSVTVGGRTSPVSNNGAKTGNPLLGTGERRGSDNRNTAAPVAQEPSPFVSPLSVVASNLVERLRGTEALSSLRQWAKQVLAMGGWGGLNPDQHRIPPLPEQVQKIWEEITGMERVPVEVFPGNGSRPGIVTLWGGGGWGMWGLNVSPDDRLTPPATAHGAISCGPGVYAWYSTH